MNVEQCCPDCSLAIFSCWKCIERSNQSDVFALSSGKRAPDSGRRTKSTSSRIASRPGLFRATQRIRWNQTIRFHMPRPTGLFNRIHRMRQMQTILRPCRVDFTHPPFLQTIHFTCHPILIMIRAKSQIRSQRLLCRVDITRIPWRFPHTQAQMLPLRGEQSIPPKLLTDHIQMSPSSGSYYVALFPYFDPQQFNIAQPQMPWSGGHFIS